MLVALHSAGKARAILRSLEIIGETSKKLNEEFKVTHPEIEWKKMARTRDRVIHHYFGVDYDIIWDIIQSKLPELKERIDQILEEAS